MQRSSVIVLLTALFDRIAGGNRCVHLHLRQGIFLPHQRSGGLHQLPRHAPQYDAWMKSSHHSAATCNDCHTPHNLIGKYAVKASNGFLHSFYFTTGLYPDTIEITKFDHKVTEDACRRCHENITAAIDGNVVHGKAEGLQCTRCHNSVGHSESASPD